MLNIKCGTRPLNKNKTVSRVAPMAASIAATCAAASLSHAAVLYTSMGSSPTSYYTFNGTDPSDTFAAGSGNGNGDDYNVGNLSFSLTGFSFYGGDTDPNQTAAGASVGQYGVNMEFYNLAGNRVASVQLPASKVYGIGLHTLSGSDLTQGGSSVTLSGAGYFSFEPYYLTLNAYNSSTGGFDTTPPPPGRPQFSFGFGGAPTIGVNNPNFSAQTNAATAADPVTTVTTGAYAAGGNATAQYGEFELDGTPSIYNSTNPIWSATGSGTWETTANWTKGVPNSNTATANFVGRITSNATVTLTAAKTVGTIDFDNNQYNYTIAGSSALTLSASSGTAAINSWAGSNVISCPISFSSGLNVQAFADPSLSTPSLTLPLNISAGGTLTKTGVGTLSFTASTAGITTLNLPAVTISAGTVALQSNAAHANRTLLTTTSLSIASTAMLNLGSNDLDDSGDTFANLNQLVANGYAGGAWNGAGGITSSAAGSNSSHLTALGLIQNNQNGTPLFTATRPFDGTTPGASDILVKYTYYGDANLDGKVDGSDYSLIDNGYLTHATGWLNGDFNYDGVVNGSDYTLIDNAFNTQGAALTAEIASPTAQIDVVVSTSAVPEPATLGILLLGGAGLLGRRRPRATDVACFSAARTNLRSAVLKSFPLLR